MELYIPWSVYKYGRNKDSPYIKSGLSHIPLTLWHTNPQIPFDWNGYTGVSWACQNYYLKRIKYQDASWIPDAESIVLF